MKKSEKERLPSFHIEGRVENIVLDSNVVLTITKDSCKDNHTDLRNQIILDCDGDKVIWCSCGKVYTVLDNKKKTEVFDFSSYTKEAMII